MDYAKLPISQIAAAMEEHLESQYFEWEILSISEVTLENTFTEATISYTHGTRISGVRWSFRHDTFDDRVIIYFNTADAIKVA